MILTTFCLNACLIMMVENDFSFYQQIHNICVTKQFRLETEKINPDLICQPVSVILLSSPFQWDLEIVFGCQAKVNRTRFNQNLYIRYSCGVLCQPHHQLSVCHHHHHCCSCSPPCFSLLIIVQYHPDTLCVSTRSVVDTVNTILIIFIILIQGLGPACGGKSLRRGVTPEEQRIILDVHNK